MFNHLGSPPPPPAPGSGAIKMEVDRFSPLQQPQMLFSSNPVLPNYNYDPDFEKPIFLTSVKSHQQIHPEALHSISIRGEKLRHDIDEAMDEPKVAPKLPLHFAMHNQDPELHTDRARHSSVPPRRSEYPYPTPRDVKLPKSSEDQQKELDDALEKARVKHANEASGIINALEKIIHQSQKDKDDLQKQLFEVKQLNNTLSQKIKSSSDTQVQEQLKRHRDEIDKLNSRLDNHQKK